MNGYLWTALVLGVLAGFLIIDDFILNGFFWHLVGLPK